MQHVLVPDNTTICPEIHACTTFARVGQPIRFTSSLHLTSVCVGSLVGVYVKRGRGPEETRVREREPRRRQEVVTVFGVPPAHLTSRGSMGGVWSGVGRCNKMRRYLTVIFFGTITHVASRRINNPNRGETGRSQRCMYSNTNQEPQWTRYPLECDVGGRRAGRCS